ncbi:MAG: esterase [Lachnospiraceae bacterium]|nr:esterase [Lachnospiraceae bacterium]
MEVREYGNRDARNVLIQPVGDHDTELTEREIAAIREQFQGEFRLVTFKVDDWNRDLAPWEAPAVFGKEGFGNGAGDTLREIFTYCVDETKTYYLGGYSLAGLFALWAAYQTDRFQGIAAASPSVWFPGFADYMKEHRIRTGRVYLSLGDREEKTRNPVMAAVGNRIREAYELLRGLGVDCTLEWNTGNHFADADQRTAKAFAWVMGHGTVENKEIADCHTEDK